MSKLGTIHVHPKGFAFVSPQDDSPDVFIPKHQKNGAVDGDLVEFESMDSSKKGKGPEGFVVEVVERARKHLVGIVEGSYGRQYFAMHVAALGPKAKVLLKSKKRLKEGERILMNVEEWGEEDDPTICTFTESFGSIKDASKDIEIAIKEFDLPSAFPKAVVDEAHAYGSEVREQDLAGREDFTKLETFTIDPDTAKDYDDALSLTKDKKGYHLAVHIADVTAYVQEGSELDKEALNRCNSTYFPNICVPMLPPELSNELCSLKSDVVRLTVTVLMDFTPNGEMLNYKIVRGFIKSQKRFTYKEALEVLEGRKKSKHAKTMHLMKDLCLLLKGIRHGRGSVDMALSETVLKIDKKGMPVDLEVVEYDITHQLVEEFMLKANEVVAQSFAEKGRKTVYRVHEEPGEDKLKDFYTLARMLGFSLPDKVSQEDIQKLFAQAKGSPYEHQIAVGFIRSMKLAIYSPDNVGHFGLGLENYCHFTSPIRRYSDLITHRLLFDYHDTPLEPIAKECSDKERRSYKAEMSVKKLKKLRYLKRGESYDAVITKIKPFGLSFELDPLSLEGFIRISNIGDDYYEYEEKTQRLLGKRTKESFAIGDKISVHLDHLDLIHLEAHFSLD